MKPHHFSSSLSDEMKHFVELKQISGSDYAGSAGFLYRFDRHLISFSFKGKTLNESILQEYLNGISHLSARGFMNQYGVLRQFTIWLNQRVESSYILESRQFPDRSHSRSAYIFTIDEIKKIICCCGGFSSNEQVIPGLYRTVFSLLYSTGMRIGEVLALNRDDYTGAEKRIHIRNGKFHKERYLVLSVSTAGQLNNYLNYYQSMMMVEGDSPLFLNLRKKRLTYQNVSLAFKKSLNRSEIGREGKPRLHCFRHTYAIHRLLQWYRTGRDVNALLPVLSTYMGHVNIASTQVYLESSNELLRIGCERFHNFFIAHSK